ncbi:hypothetical protein JYU34_013974, partial [Plutella xylostella]
MEYEPDDPLMEHLISKPLDFERLQEEIKENRRRLPPLGPGWLVLGCVLAAAAPLLLQMHHDRLPTPLTRGDAPPTRFCAEIAKEHLHNLTVIGPRVAGSYENEVLAVTTLVATLRRLRAGAAPHHRLDIDVQRASGNFSIDFLDGMNNVYRSVQSVVARVSAAGAPPAPAPAPRDALLLNCHYDTVPDSPGASDDAAGCAVLLEVLRALLARRSPLRRAAVFLFNGAEENIMQASHAFITQHKWAREVRAFINIEACGAGGREVLFQAGPHDPWIMEVYGAVVPHPYASSVAQELFEARLVPGDTDFRIFRDFGNLSGVDLAWSSNGYVYHTALDAAARVPAGSLQRTGDNVLALALGMLNHEAMSLPTARAGPGVFFDVAGLRVLQLAPAAAAAAAVALLLLAGVRVHFTARDAHRQLFIRRSEWWWIAARAAARQAAGAGAGLAAAAATGLTLHVFDARLAWYNTPVLVGPLFALPAVLGAWHVALGGAGGRLAAARGWAARAAGDALALQSAAALAACLLLRMRAGFLPAAAVAAAATDILPSIWKFKDGARWAVHFLAWLLPALLAVDLALGSLQMFIPVLGRAGDAAPADVVVALASGALAQGVCASLQPLVLLTRNPQPLMRGLWALSAVSLLLVLTTSLGMPYSPQRPQRLMLFHTRVTEHGRAADTDHLYWLPATDANTYTYLQKYSRLRVRELRELVPMSEEECSARLYCGAPYYLPVRGLLPRALWLPAPEPPAARLAAAPRLARRR